MQNFSLQSPQNSALTKISALSTKPEPTTNADAGPAFKEVLSGQVRSQSSEAQQSSTTKSAFEQRIAQGVNKTTPPKQAQPADAKVSDGNTTAKNKEAANTDNATAMSDIKEVAGLSLEDLETAKNVKRLADKLDTDSDKIVPESQQPVSTDATLAAIAIPLQVSTVPQVQTTHGVIAKEDYVTTAESKTDAISQGLESDALKNGDLSTKAQAEVVKFDTANTKTDVSDWVNSVLPNPDKQADAALGTSKLTAASISELAAKTATNNVIPNIATTAALNPLSAAQAASSNVISASPGKTGWDQAISQKMVWMVGAGEQSATLTLNPPDLGPLQVVIHVHNDQADTTFISDNSDVRRALQDGLSNLKDMLGQSGINLGQANINSSQQEQQARQSSREGNNSNENGFKTSEIDTKPTLVTRVSNGLVDTFA